MMSASQAEDNFSEEIDISDSQVNQYFSTTVTAAIHRIAKVGRALILDIRIVAAPNLSYTGTVVQHFPERRIAQILQRTSHGQIGSDQTIKVEIQPKEQQSGIFGLGIKKIQKKIKEVSQGYKHIVEKHNSCIQSEKKHRSQRLNCQQKKNHLYKKYCELQATHHTLLTQIDSYDDYELQYNQLKSQNDRLCEQVTHLQQRREVGEGEGSSRKEQLKGQIKKLYERIKLTEKEDEQIAHQYQSKKKRQAALEREQASINHRNIQIGSLFSRAAKLKEECKERRWSKMEQEREYRELLAEEAQVKRDIAAEADYRAGQRREKEKERQKERERERQKDRANVVHNFRIIDSQADEQLGKFNAKHKIVEQRSGQIRSGELMGESSESGQQLDQLINRFQKIKGKNKNS